MSAPTFSVIVPVWRAAAYLRDNMQSVLDQTFTDFELWLIDDGSPDDSGLICDQLAQVDPRIHVHHQANAGPSAARNYGIEHATGEYLCFMDADDRVKTDWLETYNRYRDADVMIQGVEIIGKRMEVVKIIRADNKVYDFESGGRSDLIEQIPFALHWTTWTKSFSRKFLLDNGLRYNESIRRDEDPLFMLTSLPVCKSIRVIDHVGYCYQTANSCLGSVWNEVKTFADIRHLTVAAIDRCFAEEKYRKAYRILCSHCFGGVFYHLMRIAVQTPRQVRIEIYRWARGYRKYIDFDDCGLSIQVYRLLWLPDWLFDILLLLVSATRAAWKELYYLIRPQKRPEHKAP